MPRSTNDPTSPVGRDPIVRKPSVVSGLIRVVFVSLDWTGDKCVAHLVLCDGMSSLDCF